MKNEDTRKWSERRMQVDKNLIKKQVEVLKKLCLLVTDNSDELEAGRIFLPLDYQEALFGIIDYAEELEKGIDRLETEIWLRDKYPHEWWEHLEDHEDIQEEE